MTRFNDPHDPLLRSFLRPWSNNNFPRCILPLFLLSLFSFSTLPVASAQGGLHIDPLVTIPQQCGSFTFTWSGGVPPYTFRIKATTFDTTLRDPFAANGTKNTSYTWYPVDIQGGTSLFAEVKDSDQQKAISDMFVIQSGGDSSCLGTDSSASSMPSSTSSGDSASTTSSTPILPLSSSSTPTPSSPSSSSSRKSSDRLSTGVIAGIAVGLAILIILATGAFFYFRRRRRAVRGVAGLLGGAKYRAARSSAGTSAKSTELPATFWDANLFVREKTATTQVRDSLLSPLIPYPDLGPQTLAPRGTLALHSKRDDELVSLVDPDSDSDSDSDLDASEVLNTRSSHPPLSPTSSPNTPANASRGHLPDGTEPAGTTGGDAGSRSHGSRP